MPLNPIVDLGIDLASFEPARALSIKDACEQVLRGRQQRPLHPEVARRWIVQGCFPAGKDGAYVRLPAIMWAGAWHTMPEWCEAFERKRVEIGQRLTVAKQEHREAVGAQLRRIAGRA